MDLNLITILVLLIIALLYLRNTRKPLEPRRPVAREKQPPSPKREPASASLAFRTERPKTSELKAKVLNALCGNKAALERLYASKKQQYPSLSCDQIYQEIYEDWWRDYR